MIENSIITLSISQENVLVVWYKNYMLKKFQVNISEDDCENFEKPNGRTFSQRAITRVKVGQPRQK